MIYPFHVTYKNMWHFTTESILPILDYLPVMKKEDMIIIPNISYYPVDLVKRILAGFNVVVEEPFIPKKYTSCYMVLTGVENVRRLCSQLLTYVEKKPVTHPCIYMNFRLHSRRWLPIDNIQKLVDALKDRYTIVLSLNPTFEKANAPKISGVISAYDLSYEEQLSYAASADYAIFGNGAGMIFPRIVGLPSVMLTPCLITETSPVGPYYGGDVVVVSDKRPDYNRQWNFDMENISVDTVLDTFNHLVAKYAD
jgi:hypothetical protein